VNATVNDSLADLNPAQHEAVNHGQGPLLVLAGAGSGKTRVLSYRIAHLIATGVARPTEITAVTFTNKAAREMRDRVDKLVGGGAAGAFVGTFHRWALELLRRYPTKIGLRPGFAIVDGDDQRVMMKEIIKDAGLDPRDHVPRRVLGRISRHVNRCAAADELDELTRELWDRYSERKRREGVVDFDDMLVLALKMLRSDERIRGQLGRSAKWLLVDEFQDTNRLQMRLLDAALSGDRNITAVGDEDQSIYRWRGAEMGNILDFERHFPGARVVALEENYRSTAPILSLAGKLIAGNHQRRGKRLFTSRSEGEPVRLYVAEDERAEARWVVDRIEELERQHSLGEIAVLMRTNAQTRPFEEELTRRRVAHRVIGGLRFWQREEVRHALAYLRLVVRPDDVLSFRRVVNVPARGIGAVTLDLLARHAADTGLPLVQAARELPEGLTPRARLSLTEFFRILDEAAEQEELLEPGDFVGWLLEESGLLMMYEGQEEERVARRENLAQLAAAVAEAASRQQGLADFLDAVALLADADEESAPDAVSLMTLHSAKGLEFDVVFLAGLEDGLLPHANSRDELDDLEEERRLAYVGMTRARHWLALAAARTRFLFGQRQPSRPSRFLDELSGAELKDVSELGFGFGPQAQPAADASPPRRSRTPARAGSARGPRAAPTVTDGHGTGWRPGDRVRHRRFGDGVVLKCEGRGGNLKLVVYFDRAGRKTLVPTIAKLEKV
jgi:DNA helicase-2/ATP-dependent DNA helicase PcrA